MAEDKIKISWEETQSAKVDGILKQQDALARAQQHYQQGAEAGTSPGATPHAAPPARGGKFIWYNTLFYMALFGAAGGLLAWASGEIAYRFERRDIREYQDWALVEQQIAAAVRDGKMNQAQADAAFQQIDKKIANNPYFKVVADKGMAPADAEKRIREMADREKDLMRWVSAIWFLLCGTVLAFALALGEPLVSRNWHSAVVNASMGAALGLLGGILLSLFADKLYQAMGGGLSTTHLGIQIIARAVVWAILGIFLSAAPGIVLRSWKRFGIGLAGGALGGLLGGLFFDPVGLFTNSGEISRFFGIVTIGTFVGVGTGLIENIAKTGWLRVVAGLIAGKQFILYRNPTYIGSSPRCEIYLFKDAQVRPQHAALHLVPGGFEIEDLNSGTGTFVNGMPITRVRLRNGDQVQIGSTCFVFQEKARTTA
jgi:Inner membrane component of T3SS, cytoplasmic domain